jgi:5-formyltetrahydrofolate cyclo-ligase
MTDISIDKDIYSNIHDQRIVPNLSDLVNAKMNEEELSALRKRKQALRKEVRTSINANFPAKEAAKLLMQSNLVFSRLFDLPQYQSAKSIGFFLSMPYGEIQTRDAIRKIVQDGKVLFVPRVGLDFEKCDMDMVRAVIPPSSDNHEDQLFYDCWPKNKWNIPEPPIKNDSSGNTFSLIAQPGDIDLLLVPGLAFDSNGHRLGQGKGYYDRFISKMRCTASENKPEEKKPLLVGVCLDEQFMDADGFDGIPVTDHDYIMDMMITPTKTLVVAMTSR